MVFPFSHLEELGCCSSPVVTPYYQSWMQTQKRVTIRMLFLMFLKWKECVCVCARTSGNRWGVTVGKGCRMHSSDPSSSSSLSFMASWVESAFSVLTQQAQHKSVSLKNNHNHNHKPLNPISQTCLFQSAWRCKVQGWRRKERGNEKHREVSQRDVSFFRVLWTDSFPLPFFPRPFYARVSLWMCVCVWAHKSRSLQVHWMGTLS